MLSCFIKLKKLLDNQACVLLDSRFRGTLKYLWDNALDIISQDYNEIGLKFM